MSVTYQPKRKKRMTTHGFLVRMSTPSGRNIIRNRRRAGRVKLAVQPSKIVKQGYKVN
ncbi:MAG: hypothetical protein RI996_378 [Candidatus Parcubacteria bacterium]|jgi:large subunit ribosomal protein L34